MDGVGGAVIASIKRWKAWNTDCNMTTLLEGATAALLGQATVPPGYCSTGPATEWFLH
jgi:hypothetical protein